MKTKGKSLTLQNYTLRYLVIALLIIVAVWAGLFYAVILDEVYDNIDDGLKNSKIQITRKAYSEPAILNTPEFGINQFKIEQLPKGNYNLSDRLTSTFEFSEYDNENQPIRLLESIFYDAQGNPHKLTIRASMVEEDELLEDLLTALVALYIMLVVSIAVINRYILKKAWKPFYVMMHGLKQYNPGEGKSFTTTQSAISEFEVLGSELESLVKRNEAVYASQKQFIENAAHELQTPLAISLNKLELFAQGNELTGQQFTELGKISDTLHRMVRLNKSLLLLSKIENRQYTNDGTININELALQLKEDFEDLAMYKNIDFTVTATATLYFAINKGLVTALLSNLVKNAIVHNHKGGFISITINSNTIVVANSGNDTPLKSEAIYNRFYRSTLNEQSTGLGLSIVKSIVLSYNIDIDYTYNGSHNFTLTFPVKI